MIPQLSPAEFLVSDRQGTATLFRRPLHARRGVVICHRSKPENVLGLHRFTFLLRLVDVPNAPEEFEAFVRSVILV
ncbi:hypothetical protein UC8_23080 [Roseimaritima ulvae]|uniref:Uncharacterized protein n=1 Tax=Roseimaritima ulvae TaxID=980254 RepID=A0A5B9R240_9BACT|nr:hypothetical protein UC8_23080 [Roseimaritima ulvae]